MSKASRILTASGGVAALVAVRLAWRFGVQKTVTATGGEDWVGHVAFGVIGLLVIWFLMVAWRDMLMLVTGPSRMGLGVHRVWAVARHAMREAWAARVWGVVVLWVVAAGVLLALAKPYEEEDRIKNYLFILLRTQELLILVFVAVLACLSLPRERERRTIITTGSKPLSRLELYLGKVVGFMGVGLVMLAVMALLSWGFLATVNARIKSTARAQLALALEHYGREAAGGAGRGAGDEAEKKSSEESIASLRALSEQGTLFAYNYITAGKGGMQVLGFLDMDAKPPRRALRGGAQEKILYRFPALNPETREAWLLPVERSPSIVQFLFVVAPYGRPLPKEFDIQVTAVRLPSRLRQMEKSVRLRMVRGGEGNQEAAYWGFWQIDRPEDVLGGVDAAGALTVNDVEIQVRCAQPGVYLYVMDPSPSAQGANVAVVRNAVTGEGVYCPEAPRLIGFEKRDKQQFQGYDSNEVAWVNGKPASKTGIQPMMPEMAAWRFENVRRSQIPLQRDMHGKEVFTLSLDLDVEKTANQDVPALMSVQVWREYAPADQMRRWTTDVTVVEKRRMPVQVPAELLSTEGETLTVYLSAKVPGHWIAGNDISVRIEQKPGFFAVNLLKSELVVFAELTLLVIAAVTCSVRLGFPVALLTTATVYILGWCLTFIRDLQQASGLGQLGFTSGPDNGMVYKAIDGVLAVMFKVLYIVVNLLPDFSRFDPTAYIMESRSIPWLMLGWHGLWAALWVLPMVAVGYLMIRKQELA